VIRARLTRSEPCRAVSTTLIEAGVDVDFPTVYRAECGLDQLAQAAGRCNRNGKRPVAESLVHMFRLDGTNLNGERQRRVAMARSVLRQHDDPLALAAVRAFFQQVYWLEGDGLDAKELMKLHEDRAVDWQFDFAEIALRFRMLDDESEPVLIPFDNEARRVLGVFALVRGSTATRRDAQAAVLCRGPAHAADAPLSNLAGLSKQTEPPLLEETKERC
jgi:CRISPR-associated endonuclease/helicase Cas3